MSRIGFAYRTVRALPTLLRHRADSPNTTADRFVQLARERPNHPFVCFEGRQVSYAQHNAAANRVAHWADAAGLACGDTAALLMENRPEFLETWAGLAKLGVTTALINTNLSGRALAHALDAASTRTLVVGSELADRLETLDDETRRGLRGWVRGEPGVAANGPEGTRDLDEALSQQSDSEPDRSLRAERKAGDDLFYIYTSGTTGLPKAARFSHTRFMGMGAMCNIVLALEPKDVHYCALPLYHSAGGAMLVSSVLASGATIGLRRKFSASQFWPDVRDMKATAFQYIGEFCRYLLNQPMQEGERDHSVRVIIGNGLRPDIWEEFQQRFGIERIVEFYGATEGNTALMNIEGKVGSVGRAPFSFVSNARLARYDVERDEHIRGDDGLCIECEPDETGELLGKIDDRLGRFEGYTSKADSDKKILRDVFDKGDSWFRSGDLLSKDREGYFYFVDRIGDTFRWKGENVSTQEVAEILGHFPGLEMVNVYGVEVLGQDGRAGMAAIQPADESAFDPEALYRHVDAGLARYAAPLFVRILRDVEVTGTFKLRKVDLQKEGFDLTKVSDPILVRDDDQRSYVPLTPEIAATIQDGSRRI
jgi:fatty-acyl-CoA synthase